MPCTMDMHGKWNGAAMVDVRCMVAMAIAADSLLSIVLRAEKLTRVIILAGRQEKMGHSKTRNPVCLQRIM